MAQRVRRIGRVRQSIGHSPALPKTSMKEVDSDDEEERSGKKDLTNLADLPWHHAQLYRLYGESADYFIHPKLELKGLKVPICDIKPNTCHIGAEELWEKLRLKSKEKLLSEDQRFPQELKEAYSAFVRESFNKHKTVVKRSYCATEDVPDMDHLLDKSRIHKIHTARHQTELMYRASRKNHNTMAILMFNNPLPDVNNEKYGISRFFYSEDNLSSERKQPEKIEICLKDSVSNIHEEVEADPEMKEVLQSIIRKPEKPLPKIRFLTERDAQEPGQFRLKFQQKKENQDLLPAYADTRKYRAQSSLGFSQKSRGASGKIERSQSLVSVKNMKERFASNWQPLSMSALMEYKQKVNTFGEGEFNQGKPTFWPTTVKT